MAGVHKKEEVDGGGWSGGWVDRWREEVVEGGFSGHNSGHLSWRRAGGWCVEQ